MQQDRIPPATGNTANLHGSDGGGEGIFVAVGSNLPMAAGGSPQECCERALSALHGRAVSVAARSPWYRSAPLPPSGQPDFINGVVRVETALSPWDLLAALHAVEDRLGRTRTRRNEARIIDLDLIDYRGLCCGPDPAGGGLVLPHPRLEERAFVVLPLADLAAGWRHPRSGRTLPDLISSLPPGQRCIRLGPDISASSRCY